jgi:hypothetical protein
MGFDNFGNYSKFPLTFAAFLRTAATIIMNQQ